MEPSVRFGRRILPLIIFYIFGTGISHSQESETLNADGTQVLPDLLDAERAFQIARTAAESGDNQTAIVALERVLLINPDLGNIKFELGLLYRNVGATNRAIFYLTESLKDDSMPEAIRLRVDSELLALRGQEQRSRGQIFGSLSLRGQYDSNALSESDFLQLDMGEAFGGVDISPNESETLGSDTTFRANAGVGYRNRFGDQGNFVWNNTLNVFTTRVGANIRSSLEIPMAIDGERASFTPFLQASISEDSESDSSNVGAGVTLRKSGGDYSSAVTLQSTRDEDNSLTVASIGLGFQQTDSVTNNFSISLGFNNGEAAFEDYSFFGFGYSIIKRVSASTWPRPILISGGFNARFTSYDEVNSLLDREVVREDERTSLFTTASFPFSQRLTGTVGLRWVNNTSSIVNNEFDNSQFSAGLNWRFD